MPKNTVSEDHDSLGFINEVLNRGIRDRVTDIHWEPLVSQGSKELVIRFRIDGVLRDVDKVVRETQQLDSLINAIKIMSGLDPTKKRREQDGFSVRGTVARRVPGGDLEVASGNRTDAQGRPAGLGGTPVGRLDGASGRFDRRNRRRRGTLLRGTQRGAAVQGGPGRSPLSGGHLYFDQ